jgi:hypothetical protein
LQEVAALPFTQEELAAYRLALSEERIEGWRLLAEHPNLAAWRARVGCRMPATEEFAIKLHDWNAVLSFSLLASLQILEIEILEISLRNHMHAALSRHFSSEYWWGILLNGRWSVSNRLIGDQAKAITDAIRVAERRTKGATSGRVISELSFGFWLGLISAAYDNPDADRAHWRNCLNVIFSNTGRVSRRDAHQELAHIINLRNMCAHHEAIVQMQIIVEFTAILTFARRFSHHTADWIANTSLVPHLMKPDWLKVMKLGGMLIGTSNI